MKFMLDSWYEFQIVAGEQIYAENLWNIDEASSEYLEITRRLLAQSFQHFPQIAL